jgi:hypothetical protein
LADLKFWNRFVPQDQDYITLERQLRIIACTSKKVYTYDIPSLDITQTQNTGADIKSFTEIVVVSEESFFLVKADSSVWFMRGLKDSKSQDDDEDAEYKKM